MKNLKKGLAVAMSLAMIATVMPTMNVNASGEAWAKTVCDPTGSGTAKADEECGKLVYAQLVGKKIADYTMADKKIVLTAGTSSAAPEKVDYFTAVFQKKTELGLYQAQSTTGVIEVNEIQTWLDTVAAIDAMFTGALLETPSISGGAIATAKTNMTSATNTWTVTGLATPANLTNAKAALKAMNEFVSNGYDVLLTIELQEQFESVRYELEENITTVVGDTSGEDLKDFVLTWEKILKFDLANAETPLTLSGLDTNIITSGEVSKISLSSKAALNARIKMIKDHDFYISFKDEEAVTAIIEAYEELIANIDGNKDLTKSDSYKAYVSEKTADANKTPKIAIKDMIAGADTDAKKIAAIVAKIDNEQFEALKAYKEDVLDEVLTMSTRKIGNYHIDDSAWSKTISTTVKNTVKNNLPDVIFTLVDTTDGLFGYDVIVEHMADFNEALDAVTTDIAKITPANIKAADKAKLEAAEDAIYELTKEGKGAFVNNLTDKEERSLRAADRKIENLREAFDNLGITSATGWYDKGNGNWGYNDENGAPVTKWVAAGKLWYYVKGGDMLRNSWVAQDATGNVWYYVNNAGEMVVNTTIDGYAINANGEWHK